jgi:ABC-2 type transport system permease protein
MGTATVIRTEFGCARKVMLRDPQAAFVTLGLPLLYLFIFATVFGSEVEQLRGQPGTLHVSTVVVASVIVVGAVSAAFQNLASSLVQDRENGVLKRLRSTPVPTSAFLAGPVLNALITACALAVLVAALGRVAYGVSLPAEHLPAAVVTVLVGALSCCAIGCLFTVVIRKATAATPTLTAVTLMLFFLSGNFFSTDQAPAALRDTAALFPIRHFLTAMLTAFNPNVTGAGFAAADLAILAIWGIFSAVLAARIFRWTPVSES